MHHALLYGIIIINFIVIIGVANTVCSVCTVWARCFVCFLISFLLRPNVFFLDWVLPFRLLTSVCVPFFRRYFFLRWIQFMVNMKLKTESYRNGYEWRWFSIFCSSSPNNRTYYTRHQECEYGADDKSEEYGEGKMLLV